MSISLLKNVFEKKQHIGDALLFLMKILVLNSYRNALVCFSARYIPELGQAECVSLN